MNEIRSRIRDHRTWVIGIGLILLALLVPVLAPGDRWIRVGVLVLIYIVLASGLNLLVGFTGLLDLGYVAFFTVGSYFTAIVSVKVLQDVFGVELNGILWFLAASIPAAAFVAAGFGVILGYPTLRARGDYLAIMTLAFGEVVRIVAINWTWLTNGPRGIRGIPPISLDGNPISATGLFIAGLALAVVIIIGIIRLTSSYIGRAWVAIREDTQVASASGVDARRYKLLAYASGAFIAGIIGVFFAHAQQFINPDSFTLDENFIILALVIVGGAGTIWGPIAGALIWVVFQEWATDLTIVQDHPEFRYLVISLLILIVIIRFPRGLVHVQPELQMRGGRALRAMDSTGHPIVDRFETPETGVVLQARDLDCRFGGLHALRGVNADLRSGEILGIIGPNGAGKTTLFNVLSGFQKPTSGEVVILGQRLTKPEPHLAARMGLARTFQNIRLFAQMTVTENLLVGAHDRLRANPFSIVFRTPDVRRRELAAQAQAAELLSYIGMSNMGDRIAGTLSYGDQRRVEIARALMSEPGVLLLDEPAAGMNPTETEVLGALVQRIRQDGITVALIEHDMKLVMSLCDRILVLDRGSLIAEGTPREVQRNEVVMAAYLGAEI
jgi:branched-chain amino acid transport system permease protein